MTKLDRLARWLRDATDIGEDLTRREARLNIGGAVDDPTDNRSRPPLIVQGSGSTSPTATPTTPRATPFPTVLVVDASGVVRFVDVHVDDTERTEVSAILGAVAALGG